MLRKEMYKVENYFEAFLVLFLICLFFYLIKSFFMPLFLAATLVFLCHKFYKALATQIRNEYVAALFILFIVVSIIILPLYMLTASLLKETSGLIFGGIQIYNSFDLNSCNYQFCSTIKNNINFINSNLDYLIKKFGQDLADSVSVFFSSVTRFFTNLFIFILAFFFLLKDGDKFMRYVRRIIPMKNEYKDALFLRFKDVSLAVFVDSIFVAIIQGSLVGVGFAFFGITAPIFWGTVASFFALIPMVGTTIIWIPAVIYLIYIKSYYSAMLLGLYCMVIVGLSDNVVRTLMLNKKIKVHPFLILLSVFGGIEVFGFLGIFLGPIIISLLISVLQLYQLDFT